MPTPPLSDELAKEAADAYRAAGGHATAAAAKGLGVPLATFKSRLKVAALRGMLLDTAPAMPGFEITRRSQTRDGSGNLKSETIGEKLEASGEPFKMPATHFLGKITVHRKNGVVVQDWPRLLPDAQAREAAMREMVAAMASELPRAEPINSYRTGSDDKCNQFTVTDYHFGMMAWGEETGGADWDLKIAERLWCRWWSYAVRHAPEADTAILAQLGDLLHFDGMKAITPAHGHVLDSDSRFAKIVRVVIRCMRYAVRELLTKHRRVHLIFSDANHDEAGEVWMRELFAAHFEDEPRVTVDRSPSTYNAFEWGLTSLFYHHGHKKRSGKGGSSNGIDATWVARFREIFGRTKFSYGHTGHLHSDEMFTGATGIKVERHETLAAPSTYEASGGYESGRSAKVITYSKRFGQCGRLVITPEMVMDDAETAA